MKIAHFTVCPLNNRYLMSKSMSFLFFVFLVLQLCSSIRRIELLIAFTKILCLKICFKTEKRKKSVWNLYRFNLSGVALKAVAGLALDFVFIDTEHIPIDRNELTYVSGL